MMYKKIWFSTGREKMRSNYLLKNDAWDDESARILAEIIIERDAEYAAAHGDEVPDCATVYFYLAEDGPINKTCIVATNYVRVFRGSIK